MTRSSEFSIGCPTSILKNTIAFEFVEAWFPAGDLAIELDFTRSVGRSPLHSKRGSQ